MGLSPLGNLADVHAAESEISQNAVTEKESKTESDHPVSEISEQTVTAEDITKDVSDKEFMAETCMEGIQYDPEKEDVALEHIEAEDGSAYHPDQEGTYIATYWVVPKDARDSYSVTRKIILTDTEGQAHAEENGGQKQKEDTKSEEDSETPVQEIPDVEVTISGEDADAQAARELEEKIEDGEVMMFSGAENTFTCKRNGTSGKRRNHLLSKLYWKLSDRLVYRKWKDCLLSGIPSFFTAKWRLCGTGIGQQ